ncbi:MAG: hypothetical protein K0S33_1940 [Bacteroidetes bacterium]|jgi:nucleotide-binding universal stress UspA family protein|nr:hypothetical protein [Bacteroidota bacterium]
MTARTILVPTDFSDAARNASDYAISLAKAMHYEVLLFHVYNTPVVISSDRMGAILLDVVQIEKDIKLRLKEEVDFLNIKHGIEARYESSDGLVADEIVEAEKKYNPALIVMGMTEEASALSEFVLGSTSTDILNRIHTPLIIVPEKVGFKKIERVAFASDPRLNLNVDISSFVKDMFEKFYSTVYILSVVTDPEAAEQTPKTTDEHLEKHFENRFHSYHFIEHEDVVEGINEFIDLHKIDMVTMMPQKHNFFSKIFREPNTKRLAFHSHVPLLSLANTELNKLKSA